MTKSDNGKVVKVQFFISLLFVVLFQFQLTYLKNQTELRDKTLSTDRYL